MFTFIAPLLLAQAAPQAPAKKLDNFSVLQECSARFARSFALRSRESAAIIVDAALGACAAQETAFAKTVFDAFPLDRAGSRDAQDTYNFRIDRLKRQLVAVVLDERIKNNIQ